MNFQDVFWIILLVINIVVFGMYGVDKNRAIKQEWRIPEKTLLLGAACFGSVGALLGMKVFRHKTRKTKFLLLVPLCLSIQVILLAIVLF